MSKIVTLLELMVKHNQERTHGIRVREIGHGFGGPSEKNVSPH